MAEEDEVEKDLDKADNGDDKALERALFLRGRASTG